jgi:hypothetical protein
MAVSGCLRRHPAPVDESADRKVADAMSLLVSDLHSQRRDEIRIAIYYLNSRGCPVEGGTSHDQLQRGAAAAMQWLEAQDAKTATACVDGYPEFKLVQSPVFAD